jgi:hypothetical protein
MNPRSPLLAALTLLCAAAAAAPGGSSAPQVPEALQVPAGEQLLLRTHATGVQIYVCAANGAQWTLKAPAAVLRNLHGVVIGHHAAGPSWRLNDGSEVSGKAVAHVDSPDGKSVAWLLVTVTTHSGAGRLTPVTTIQRLHTHGGQAPQQACSVSPQSSELRVPYSADYYFYAPAPAPAP